MQCVDRYEKYKDEDFDVIVIKIRNGKYAGLVKIDKDYELKGKEFFNDGRKDKHDSGK